MKDNWDRHCSHWSLLQPQPLLMLLPSLRCIMSIAYAHTSCDTRHLEIFVVALQVSSAAASGVASFAVLEDGTVWGWGSSKRGQLGLGQGTVHALKPQRLPGLEGITEVSAGWGHACALRGKPTCHSTLPQYSAVPATQICELLTWSLWEPNILQSRHCKRNQHGMYHTLFICHHRPC